MGWTSGITIEGNATNAQTNSYGNLELGDLRRVKRPEKLTRNRTGRAHHKMAAVEAVLAYPTFKEAAAACGISSETIRLWMRNDKEFKELLKATQQERIKASSRYIQNAVLTGARTLVEIAEDRNAGETARVAASVKLVEFGLKLSMLDSLEERLETLEARANIYESKSLPSETGSNSSEDAGNGYSSGE